MAKKITDRQYLTQWESFRLNISRSTPIDLQETVVEREKRIKELETEPEKWFAYYFPNFYTSEPAKFQKLATKRVLSYSEWYEVRSWARELAKSARTMMEVLYLALTGKKKNILLVSNTYDNACRLLLPYKSILEANNRIINDYGKQESIGKWEAGEFVTQKGVAFRALGAGQSPRGTRNDSFRPDVILIDDIDTDEETRNKERIIQKIKWIEEALIPTRSISSPLLLIVCGNIIAKFCCVVEMGKRADKWDIINIRDKNGKSTWPEKNTEKDIERVLSLISRKSAQKEYFNNPVNEGDTFKNLILGKCPKIRTCEKVVVYSDPSPSNNKNSKSSKKCVVIVGFKGLKYYIYKVWLNHATNPEFIEWHYQAYSYLMGNGVDPIRMFIENNSLQDPFYQQVIKPLLLKYAKEKGYKLPLREDKRKKPEKHDRCEGTLEPKNTAGDLIFNEEEKDNPNMIALMEQFSDFNEEAKDIDGVDATEGAVWLVDNRVTRADTSYAIGEIPNRKY